MRRPMRRLIAKNVFSGLVTRLPLGGLAYQGFAIRVEGDNRRGCAGPFRIFNNLRILAFHDGYARICRSKVNTNNFSHVFLL